MSGQDFEEKYLKTNLISEFLIDNFFHQIKKLSETLKPKSVLEVGCGAGFSTLRLKSFFPDTLISASDVDEKLVAKAQAKNPEVSFSVESIYDLKRQDKSFDLVLALEVLEHLDRPEAALRELRRVTNGWCIVSVPNEPYWRWLNMARGRYLSAWGNTTGHINHWGQKSFEKFVAKEFNIVGCRKPIPWLILLTK